MCIRDRVHRADFLDELVGIRQRFVQKQIGDKSPGIVGRPGRQDTETGGEVILGVKVNYQDLLAHLGQRIGQISDRAGPVSYTHLQTHGGELC